MRKNAGKGSSTSQPEPVLGKIPLVRTYGYNGNGNNDGLSLLDSDDDDDEFPFLSSLQLPGGRIDLGGGFSIGAGVPLQRYTADHDMNPNYRWYDSQQEDGSCSVKHLFININKKNNILTFNFK